MDRRVFGRGHAAQGTLRPLLELYRERRRSTEGFGDFCHRTGVERLRELVRAEPAAQAS